MNCQKKCFLGAMISHDNITWSSRLVVEQAGQNQERLLSYLPLSHVAAFMSNCLVSICAANEVHFADPNALQQGTLVGLDLFKKNNSIIHNLEYFLKNPLIYQRLKMQKE